MLPSVFAMDKANSRAGALKLLALPGHQFAGIIWIINEAPVIPPWRALRDVQAVLSCVLKTQIHVPVDKVKKSVDDRLPRAVLMAWLAVPPVPSQLMACCSKRQWSDALG